MTNIRTKKVVFDFNNLYWTIDDITDIDYIED